MSVNPGGSDGPMSYSDHDVHHLRHEVFHPRSADSGPTTAVSSVEQFNITERGLDPDELAELRAVRVQASLSVLPQAAGSSQDQEGAFRLKAGAGFNLSGDEFLGIQGTQSESFDVDGSGTTDFQAITKDTDEVGQVYTAQLDGLLPVQNSTDANGAGGFTPHLEEKMDFDELTGSGPVVDAADDWTSLIRLETDNVVESLNGAVRYSLYYMVEETESGRTRFGR